MTSTRDEVVGLVTEVLEQPAGSVSLTDHFLEDLGASSLDIVTLVMRIEQHYGLGETPDSQLEQIETVGHLVELVDAIRQGGEPSHAAEVVDIAIASDHGGVELKAALGEWFRRQGYTFVDLGPADLTSVDYPEFARRVVHKVLQGDARRGILICGTGLGMSYAANRHRGIRAALVSETVSARLAREHNDANVLCLGGRMIGPEMARQIVEVFMNTSFTPGSDGRHRRRVQAIEPG